MSASAASRKKRVVLGITGASGAPYAKRLAGLLRGRDDVEVAACLSSPAPEVWALECGGDIREELGLPVWGARDYRAPFASGSAGWDAMVIVPCSMGTVARIAHGTSETLLTRAADVMLKERRPLVLVPRETPLSTIHLDNMLRLAHAGAVILPPAPGFYDRPQAVADLVDFVVARVLDQLRVPHDLVPRWGEPAPPPAGSDAA